MFALLIQLACEAPAPTPEVSLPPALEAHCRDTIGEPRVEQLAEGVWIARGFDLANTILIETGAGHVVIDPGMSPARAAPARAALLAEAPGAIHTIIYTHSHIDHVGGAATWLEPDTRILASGSFTEHFFKQYGIFLGAEVARGQRQFGSGVDDALLPCSSIGRRPDLLAALENGALMPSETFEGELELSIGDQRLVLMEAFGETDDQLMVWMPERRILMVGDNWYQAYPNLYTIRGSAPRPTRTWIDTLDRMRRLEPDLLIPSHTTPLEGAEAIQVALRDYRDGIQWVRDEVIRRANTGQRLDDIAAEIALPPRLAASPALRELYGQLDWSARAIYTNELGWFDGRASALYPLPPDERAAKTIEMMGGLEAVLAEAAAALERGEPRWTVHLLALAEDSGARGPALNAQVADAYEALAYEVVNTNGRAYLLQSAQERRRGPVALGEPRFAGDFAAGISLERIFENMSSRLDPVAAADAHESIRFIFPDEDAEFTVTVRYGIAELASGAPLPGTPEPLAVVTVDGQTWRRLALHQENPLAAVADGRMVIDGDRWGFAAFMARFQRGLAPPPTVAP